jgi:hypothetical protein
MIFIVFLLLQYEFDFGTFWTNMFSGLPIQQIKFN